MRNSSEAFYPLPVPVLDIKIELDGVKTFGSELLSGTTQVSHIPLSKWYAASPMDPRHVTCLLAL